MMSNTESLWEEIYRFEDKVSGINKKELGVVYTPKEIARFIVRESFKLYKDKNKIPEMLDLCCGAGVFTLAFIEYFDKELGYDWLEIAKSIHACDIDKESVIFTRKLIEKYAVINKKPYYDFSKQILKCDALFDNIKTLFDKANGFELIYSNPPYVKISNIDKKYREEIKKRYYDVIFGNFSLSSIFIKRGYELLSHHGVMGYITQNSFLTSNSGKKLRMFLSGNTIIESIISYGDNLVFKDVGAYTGIFFATKKPKPCLTYYKSACGNMPSNWREESDRIPYNSLTADPWTLSSDISRTILYKMKNSAKKLKDVADVKVGVATLKDSIFIINEDVANKLEKGILKSFIKISNRKKDKKNEWIIYPYLTNCIPMSEEYLSKNYPETYKHLLKNRKILQTRSCDGVPFYLYGREQGLKAFAPKLITSFYNKKPNFVLDNTDSLFNGGFAVISEDVLFLPLLLRLLNSRIMGFYIKNLSDSIAGGYYRYRRDLILEYPIINFSRKDIPDLLNESDEILDMMLMDSIGLNDKEKLFLTSF